jgi:hypothetical protein
MERHVALALFTFVVWQLARPDPSEMAGEVKRRLHLAVIQGDQTSPSISIGSSQEGRNHGCCVTPVT